MTHALPSAHYEPLRHPRAASLSPTGFRLVIADHDLGLPVFRALSLCTCRRHYCSNLATINLGNGYNRVTHQNAITNFACVVATGIWRSGRMLISQPRYS
jgi:hypothetical protein